MAGWPQRGASVQVIDFYSRRAAAAKIEYVISISGGFDGLQDGRIQIKQTAPESYYSVITLKAFDLAKLQQCKKTVERIVKNHAAAGRGGYLSMETNLAIWIAGRGKEALTGKRVCPVCGKEYSEYPALSRKDNTTEICPECGTREALEAAGITGQEADEIIQASKAL